MILDRALAECASCPVGAAVHVGDTAGVPQELVAGLTSLGVPACSVVPPTPLASSRRLVKSVAIPLRVVTARCIARAARRRAATLLHVHYATAAFGYLRGGVPLVVHAHGTDVRSPGAVEAQLLRPIWRASRLRIVSTPDLLENVPEAVYLPNPVDVGRFLQAAVAHGAPRRDVLVFAALTHVKGAEVLVDAVRGLLAARPDLSVTAIAGGPFERAMISTGATMIPRQRALDVPDLIADHRVVVGQQSLGALGVSELQAMAGRRPVICALNPRFDYGSRPPVLQSNGPEDVIDLVLATLDEPDRAERLGRAAADWVQCNHDRTAVAKRLVDLYRSVDLLPV